jgi:hypothetical protein
VENHAVDMVASLSPRLLEVPLRPTTQPAQVVIKDQCRGRTGVVLRRHGSLFWDVQLEATAGSRACLIFKKDASLIVL